MFTGIIEEIGTVSKSGPEQLQIKAAQLASGCKHGDSIAVNGICLTVLSLEKDVISFDVMPATRELANPQTFKPGTKVNLERAIRADSRIGGHFVQGHIDGTGTIQSVQKQAKSTIMTIKASPELIGQMVKKGSVALDGVSLTIAELSSHSFAISLVPTTLKDTVLGLKRPSDLVNIETDVLGKYVKSYLGNSTQQKSNITEDFLKKTGFLE